MKPDISRIKRLTPEQVKARLRARRENEEREKKSRAPRRTGRPRVTTVKSVSIMPEMAIRVTRDLGEGSFSRGVVKACTRALMELDKEREYRRG